MKRTGNSEPQFPLRLIYDDGGSDVVETPEELLEQVDSIDTAAEGNRVWVRDDLGRTVHLRMVDGLVELIEAVAEPETKR
jgi:hypothetical protein